MVQSCASSKRERQGWTGCPAIRASLQHRIASTSIVTGAVGWWTSGMKWRITFKSFLKLPPMQTVALIAIYSQLGGAESIGKLILNFAPFDTEYEACALPPETERRVVGLCAQSGFEHANQESGYYQGGLTAIAVQVGQALRICLAIHTRQWRREKQ